MSERENERERELYPTVLHGFWKGLRYPNKESFYYIQVNNDDNIGFRSTSCLNYSVVLIYLILWKEKKDKIPNSPVPEFFIFVNLWSK